MNKTKVICHMYTSIDGKIVTNLKGFPDCEVAGNIYDEITLNSSNAWGCGRTTFEYLSANNINLNEYEETTDLNDNFIQDERYCFAFDRKGKLFFTNPYNDYANKQSRIVSVLTTSVDKRFITYLKKHNIAYIFCGEKDLDFNLFLTKIKNYGIDTFMLCGGGEINAAFMKQDLIDEISLVICPGIQGGRKEITFVSIEDNKEFPKYFKPIEVNILEGNTVYLHYIKEVK